MKKITIILITLVLVFSLTACGKSIEDTAEDTQETTQTVYLKWIDGEELLENVKEVFFTRNGTVWITLEDGTKITTSYVNVIIFEK